MRHDEDVGEQDRRIEAEAPDRLQRHFGGKLGIVAERRGSCRPWPEARDTPADSGLPAASARSEASSGSRPTRRAERRVRHWSPCLLGPSIPISLKLRILEREFFCFDSWRGADSPAQADPQPVHRPQACEPAIRDDLMRTVKGFLTNRNSGEAGVGRENDSRETFPPRPTAGQPVDGRRELYRPRRSAFRLFGCPHRSPAKRRRPGPAESAVPGACGEFALPPRRARGG